MRLGNGVHASRALPQYYNFIEVNNRREGVSLQIEARNNSLQQIFQDQSTMESSVKLNDQSISSSPSIELEMMIGNLEEVVAALRKMAKKKHEKRQKAITGQKQNVQLKNKFPPQSNVAKFDNGYHQQLQSQPRHYISQRIIPNQSKAFISQHSHQNFVYSFKHASFIPKTGWDVEMSGVKGSPMRNSQQQHQQVRFYSWRDFPSMSSFN